MTSSTDIVVLKNSLLDGRKGDVRDLETVVNGSAPDDWTEFLEQEEEKLSKAYCMPSRDPRCKDDFGGNVAMALAEAITNFQFYANKGDHETPLFVYKWRDDNRLYYCIKGCGDGFDPQTVTIDLPKNADPRQGTPRREGPGKGRLGGWGHRIMAMFADFLAYDHEGKSMYLFFQLPTSA